MDGSGEQATGSTGVAPPGPEDGSAPPAGGGDDTLPIVALALGVTALVSGLVPFYGMGLALPLGVVAIVLGVLARRRRSSGRGMATAGAVCGAVGLVVAAVWIAAMFVPLWGFRSETAITAESMPAPPHIEAAPEVPSAPGESGADPDDLPSRHVETVPDPGPPPDALVDASGSAEMTLDGRERRLELTDCTIGDGPGGYLRGSGPDGRVLLRTGGGAGILLVVEPSGEEPLVLIGEQRGVSSSQRGGAIDRRRIELSGELRGAFDDTPVAVHFEATCR